MLFNHLPQLFNHPLPPPSGGGICNIKSIASATHINIVTLNLFQGLSNLVLLALIDAEGVNTLECRVNFSLPKI